MATKVKTKVGELIYVFVEGEGRDQAMPGNDPHMMYVASIKAKKNSELVKDMKRQIDEEWTAYKERAKLKPAAKPSTNGIKPVLDENGAETDEVLITFKTNTSTPKGVKKRVKILDRYAQDISDSVHNAPWSIGFGSTGVIHGVADGNGTGGSQKVSLYLSAVQLAKLVKYDGGEPDAEEIEGEDIDIDDIDPSESVDTSEPDID